MVCKPVHAPLHSKRRETRNTTQFIIIRLNSRYDDSTDSLADLTLADCRSVRQSERPQRDALVYLYALYPVCTQLLAVFGIAQIDNRTRDNNLCGEKTEEEKKRIESSFRIPSLFKVKPELCLLTLNKIKGLNNFFLSYFCRQAIGICFLFSPFSPSFPLRVFCPVAH